MEEEVVIYRLVAIGGSAGSLDIVLKTIQALPVNSNAAFIIVTHRKNQPDSILTNLVASRTTMRVKEVEDKEIILPNTIYLAPPDYHLLVENATNFSLDSSEKIHYSRPSINVSFESVAEVFGKHAVAVLLSGANADGADGLQKIKQAGGVAIVQDPFTAEFDYMPKQAIKQHAANFIVAADELPTFVRSLLLKR